jgi:putative FmdB family regulatory protein
MPFYDYKCSKCGLTKEFLLSMDHDTPTHQDLNHEGLDCGHSMKLDRVYHATPVIFNGDGWTDTPGMKKKQSTYNQAVTDINGGEFKG